MARGTLGRHVRRSPPRRITFWQAEMSGWWGVAGSIFGSNVSANHMVGMMGVGFAVGFAAKPF